MTLKAIVHPAEEGGFWVEVPALPGCFTQGESLEEVRANLTEAITGWFEAGESTEENLYHGWNDGGAFKALPS